VISVAGCQECAHAACKTFAMDDAEGTARVTRQWGDPERVVEVRLSFPFSWF
jgi:hypothetical protein